MAGCALLVSVRFELTRNTRYETVPIGTFPPIPITRQVRCQVRDRATSSDVTLPFSVAIDLEYTVDKLAPFVAVQQVGPGSGRVRLHSIERRYAHGRDRIGL